jgi:hypothetical protein
VSPELLERQVALAGVALLAALASLALAGGSSDGPEAAPPAPPAASRWYQAAVGVYGPGFFGTTTECRIRLTRATSGVQHPELPCGARIVVAHQGREVETRVVDRGAPGSGQQFALTQALAAELGVNGVEIVRWRFSSGR